MPGHDIIAIGASAGGIEALKQLVHALPADLPATIFVAQHLSPSGPSVLPEILQRAGQLQAVGARDNTTFKKRCIYVAPPDRHLIVQSGRIRLSAGPKENRSRPAIDPLFRSAAITYGPRVIGVVLSGTLDDGAAGLRAIKACRGTSIVQDPDEAMYADMPNNAILGDHVDHCLTLEKIAHLLNDLSRRAVKAPGRFSVPEQLRIENAFVTMREDCEIPDMKKLGKMVPIVCPHCSGALWEIKEGKLIRYRCHTGHAFSAESLLSGQSEAVEEALYSALRALEERSEASRRIANHYNGRFPTQKVKLERKAAELDKSAHVLRKILGEIK